MRWLTRLLGQAPKRVRPAPARPRRRLEFETLEDRNVPSTMSSISANFNGTAIPAGDTLWFNAALTASGLPKGAPVTIHVVNSSLSFTAGGVAYSVPAPDADVVLDPAATSATASYDPTDNGWDVSAPASGTGTVFMGGVAVPLPNGLPGGIQNMTWSAGFWSDTNNLSVNWQWAAAAYKSFGTDYNALGVKPVDNNTLSVYQNKDQSGTPEAYKSYVVAGATGGGGSNFTGNYTPNKAVTPQFGDGASVYPYVSSNPLTSVAFNESTVLVGAKMDAANGAFEIWYSDEHALALGVGTVVVKTTTGTTTTNYPIAPLTTDPGSALNPAVGTTATSGDQAGTDVSGRPMAPSLFITDITNNPSSASGDWQWGGRAYAPSAVFGAWKPFTRTVDYTTGSTPTVTVAPPSDPATNGWNLGAGADAPPAGVSNAGYGAEVRWNLNDLYSQGILIPGHNYRFYVIVHDGDQNKSGGDAGQAAYSYIYSGPPVAPSASISGYVLDQTAGGGVQGVVISLVNSSNVVVATATTDVNGYYSFATVAPGTYSLSEGNLPSTYVLSGYAETSAAPGTVGGNADGSPNGASLIGSITLNNGDIGINYDFFAANVNGGV